MCMQFFARQQCYYLADVAHLLCERCVAQLVRRSFVRSLACAQLWPYSSERVLVAVVGGSGAAARCSLCRRRRRRPSQLARGSHTSVVVVVVVVAAQLARASSARLRLSSSRAEFRAAQLAEPKPLQRPLECRRQARSKLSRLSSHHRTSAADVAAARQPKRSECICASSVVVASCSRSPASATPFELAELAQLQRASQSRSSYERAAVPERGRSLAAISCTRTH